MKIRVEDGNLKIGWDKFGEWQFGVGKDGIWLTRFGDRVSLDIAFMIIIKRKEE